jgi:hypothetical protein
MDKLLVKFLKSLDLETCDIELLVQLVPGLDFIEWARAKANIDVLVNAGYPKEDLDGIICINPGFLLYDPAELAEKLSVLGEDVETALKNDPFLI